MGSSEVVFFSFHKRVGGRPPVSFIELVQYIILSAFSMCGSLRMLLGTDLKKDNIGAVAL